MAADARDRGAAVVEFVLVGTLLVTVFLAVLQLGLVLYMRNVVTTSVVEGARYAANADRSCADGVDRVAALLRENLSSRVEVRAARCGPDSADGAALVRIDVEVSLPLLVLPGPSRVTFTTTGRAIEEGQ